MSSVISLFPTSTRVGVLFCSILLALTGCEQRQTSSATPAETEATAAATEGDAESTAPSVSPTAEGEEMAAPDKEPQANGTNIVFYNVRNYLNMDRRINGRYRKDQPKPEGEIEALVEVIESAKPEILGLCEIGGKTELEELQARLKEVGIDLPHSELVEGWDRTRRLALLSKFPITKRLSQTDLKYPIAGKQLTVSRGILDVVVDIKGQPLELLVAHLKSKREIKAYDQAEMRRNEAILLRQRMDEILDADADAKFAVMGDFNDTSKTPAIETLRGTFNTPRFCDSLELQAQNGTLWTQFWSWQHVYSRFDYIFVSPGLRPHVEDANSRILDHPRWNEASDHRALLMQLKW